MLTVAKKGEGLKFENAQKLNDIICEHSIVS